MSDVSALQWTVVVRKRGRPRLGALGQRRSLPPLPLLHKDEVRALRRIAIGLRRAFRRAEMNTVPQQSKAVGWISFALVSMRIFESLPFSGDITPTFSLP